MEINLLEIPIVIASVRKPKHLKKQIELYHHLKAFGFRSIKIYNGEVFDPYYIGVSITRNDIFSKYPSVPLTILEDDCLLTESFLPRITLPDNAEMFYWGYSSYKDYATLSFKKVDDDIVDLKRSLSMHGTTFLTKRAIRKYKKIMDLSIQRTVFPDFLLVRHMKCIKTYATVNPFAIQNGVGATDFGLLVKKG